jgi:predicted PurR-regulated permease PerM
MILKVKSIVVPASLVTFIAIIFIFSSYIVTISSFAQSDTNNNSTNQTMQSMVQSANQTVENILQDANQSSKANQGNASDGDSNLTEGAKNIGTNLTEVAKKLDETISKKLHDLAK